MKARRAWLAACLAAAFLAGCGGGGGTGGNNGGGNTVTTGGITGRVVDDTMQQPVSGANVAAGTATTTTRSDGTFSLTGLAPGTYQVTVTLTGYAFPSVPAVVVVGKDTAVEIRGPEVSQPPTVSVAVAPGTLTFVGGQVVVTATVADPEQDAVAVTGTYDLGGFTLTSQGNGTYVGVVNLPSNTSTTDRTYTFTVSVADRVNTVRASGTAVVRGLVSLAGGGGVGNSVQPGNPAVGSSSGGPPVPNIRR